MENVPPIQLTYQEQEDLYQQFKLLQQQLAQMGQGVDVTRWAWSEKWFQYYFKAGVRGPGPLQPGGWASNSGQIGPKFQKKCAAFR